MKSVLTSLFAGLAIVALAWLIQGVFRYRHYTKAFTETQFGESLSVVLERFGPPSHIEPRSNVAGYDSGSRGACGESCWLRLWYELPLTLGTSPVAIDFNVNQTVIHKYEWNSP